MFTLIIIVLIGSVIAFFATQNTGTITLYFFNYAVKNIPIYAALIMSLLIGLCLSLVLNIFDGIVTGFKLRRKEDKIRDVGKENSELLKKSHRLEIENTKLRAETNAPDPDDKSL